MQALKSTNYIISLVFTFGPRLPVQARQSKISHSNPFSQQFFLRSRKIGFLLGYDIGSLAIKASLLDSGTGTPVSSIIIMTRSRDLEK